MRARARILYKHDQVIGCEGNDDGCDALLSIDHETS